MNPEEKARRYDEALEKMRKMLKSWSELSYNGKTFLQDLKHIFPELAESDDERVRKSIIHILQVGGYMSPEEKDKAFAYLEKQKEPLPIPDKFSGLKSLMLQYLQSAANRKDDTEIESDTDLWGRKILDYVWKYSDEQKEQKPSANKKSEKPINPSSKFHPGDLVVYDGPLGHAILQIEDVLDGRYTFVDNDSTLLVEDSDKFLRPLTPEDVEGKQKPSVEDVLTKAGLKPYKDGNQWCILAGDNIQEGICGFGDTIEDALYEFLIDALNTQKEQKPLTTEETELNSIAFLEQMGYTCIPPRKEQKPADYNEYKMLIDGAREDGKIKGRKEVIDHPEKYGLQKPAEWKPQPESLEALMYAIEGKWDVISPTSYLSRRLEDLYEGLVNTYNVDESLLSELPEAASRAYTVEDIEELRELKRKIEASMEQKPVEKQDYSGLNNLERAIHRGFLSAGVENVPVTIIKETAKECLAQIKPAEWDEEDREIAQNIMVFLKEPTTAELCPQLRKECQDWLKSLPERFNLEPKEEWNEEDEACKQTILCAVQGKFVTDAALRQAILWLKSLRSRPKSSDNWKPSEGPVWRIWENGACGNSDGFPIAIVKESSTYRLVSCLGAGGEKYIMLSDLEKLPGFDNGESETAKQESHWKPSEEQMKALERTTRLANFGLEEDRRKALVSLYEHLKKWE